MNWTDDLTLGRGKLFFARMADGTRIPGLEKFFGNVPTVQVTQTSTKLDHYISTQGLKTKDQSVVLQTDVTGTFTSDNMSKDNLALWFLGQNVTETVVAPAPVVDEPHTAALGSFIQLGATAQDPQGIRNISAVTVKGAADAQVNAAGNYEVDLVKGRIYIEPDATGIVAGDSLKVSYTPSAGTSNIVVAQGAQVYGQLRFIAANAAGSNKDYFFPYVLLTSSGNLDLIADTWQAATFGFEALQLDSNTQRVYVS